MDKREKAVQVKEMVEDIELRDGWKSEGNGVGCT